MPPSDVIIEFVLDYYDLNSPSSAEDLLNTLHQIPRIKPSSYIPRASTSPRLHIHRRCILLESCSNEYTSWEDRFWLCAHIRKITRDRPLVTLAHHGDRCQCMNDVPQSVIQLVNCRDW
jgi:hypothetical protein